MFACLTPSAHEATVPAGRQALIKTDLSIAIPPNTYARIAPRSGLAVKKMIDVGAGVVDYDYRGPVGVVLFNHGSEDFKVNRGDRVAQLILERICMAELQEVSEYRYLPFECQRAVVKNAIVLPIGYCVARSPGVHSQHCISHQSRLQLVRNSFVLLIPSVRVFHTVMQFTRLGPWWRPYSHAVHS